MEDKNPGYHQIKDQITLVRNSIHRLNKNLNKKLNSKNLIQIRINCFKTHILTHFRTKTQ